eukprot:COSAG04_NODE_3663_length_2625_cov_2.644497_2_plen_183_part_00
MAEQLAAGKMPNLQQLVRFLHELCAELRPLVVASAVPNELVTDLRKRFETECGWNVNANAPIESRKTPPSPTDVREFLKQAVEAAEKAGRDARPTAARATSSNALSAPAVSILQSRLIEVKKEKAGAIEEAEDQEETTKQVTLMLDLWQSYADELKRQVKQLGGHPISWDEFRRDRLQVDCN